MYKTLSFAFVNGGYWKVHQFNFVEGRPFTEQECLNKDAYVVLREDMAEMFFKSEDVVGTEDGNSGEGVHGYRRGA